MNALELELNYPLGDTLPVPGGTVEVAPGIRWVRMALPFALNHINLWLMRDTLDGREGWTVVDCCISSDETRAQWETIFTTQLDGLPILRVIVTHMHPDHIGLADWLCQRWSTPEEECRMWISATDFYSARAAIDNSGGHGGGEGAALFFAAHGLDDPEAVDKVRSRSTYFVELVPSIPQRFRRMLDGDTIVIGGHAWRCIVGYGHAPEHIALYCAELNILIGGDMMLPRISTNVSVYEIEPEADSLTIFLRSIDRFLQLPADVLALPSHGLPFRGVHERVRQLHDHHRERLSEVLEACSVAPQSAADVLPVLFKRKLDLHQTTFAMGESIAHLHALWFGGQLRRTRGADGIYRFAP